jgi:hypothetical protein
MPQIKEDRKKGRYTAFDGGNPAGHDRLHQGRMVLLGLIAVGLREIGHGFVKSFGLAAIARDLGGIAGARVS